MPLNYNLFSGKYTTTWKKTHKIAVNMSAINSDNNNYGSVVVSENDSKIPRQRFDIAEPGSSLENPIRASLHCCRRGETDGFKIIVTSMFVFAVGVTIALIITIASGM